MNKETNKQTNKQMTSYSVNQSICQCLNWWINKSINQLINQSVWPFFVCKLEKWKFVGVFLWFVHRNWSHDRFCRWFMFRFLFKRRQKLSTRNCMVVHTATNDGTQWRDVTWRWPPVASYWSIN